MGSAIPDPELGSNPDGEVEPDFETPDNADSVTEDDSDAGADDDAASEANEALKVDEVDGEASSATVPDPELGSDLEDADPDAE